MIQRAERGPDGTTLVPIQHGAESDAQPIVVAGSKSLLRSHLLPRFGRTSLVKIEPLDVREWVSDLVAAGLSPSRARQGYQLLSMIMKAAVESRIIARTPCVGVKLKRARCGASATTRSAGASRWPSHSARSTASSTGA